MPEPAPGARRRRVPALAPDERRAAIIAACVPLLQRHGAEVSTRQIAEAAGVAEGTLFKVFPDKSSLIRAAMINVFDPQRVVDLLAGIDPGLDLRARLVAALDILRDRFDRNAALLGEMRSRQLRAGVSKEDLQGGVEFMKKVEESRLRIVEAIANLIQPDRALLRRSPETTAHLLFLMMMSTSRTSFIPAVEVMDNTEVVTLLLDGLLVRPDKRRTRGRSAA